MGNPYTPAMAVETTRSPQLPQVPESAVVIDIDLIQSGVPL